MSNKYLYVDFDENDYDGATHKWICILLRKSPFRIHYTSTRNHHCPSPISPCSILKVVPRVRDITYSYKYLKCLDVENIILFLNLSHFFRFLKIPPLTLKAHQAMKCIETGSCLVCEFIEMDRKKKTFWGTLGKIFEKCPSYLTGKSFLMFCLFLVTYLDVPIDSRIHSAKNQLVVHRVEFTFSVFLLFIFRKTNYRPSSRGKTKHS